MTKTPDEIQRDVLANIRVGYAGLGLKANVRRNSELWLRTKAFGGQASIPINEAKLAREAINPLRATGQDLVDYAAARNVTARPAEKSLGTVLISSTSAVTIPAGYRATSPDGIVVETTTAHTGIASGTSIAMQSVEAGADTEIDAGTVLLWDSATVANLNTTCTVEAGGIDGGTDADDEARLRERLLRKMGFPPVGGNWAFVTDTAEKSSAAVYRCFAYPSAQGPSSIDLALMGDPSDPVLNATTINAVVAAVEAEHPGFAKIHGTSVQLEELDVVIDLVLPLPSTQSGAIVGFYNEQPWPSSAASSLCRATVLGASSLTVDAGADDPPVAGKTFALWSSSGKVFREFTILGVTGSAGAYVLDVGTSPDFSGVDVNSYVSAGAAHLQTYADLIISHVTNTLGPGQKTDNPDILKWATRRPEPEVEKHFTLSSRTTCAITETRSEVAGALFAARYATGTTTTVTGPSLPTTIAEGPRLLSVRNIAFRHQA